MKSVKLTRAGGLGVALMASTLSGCAFDAMGEDIVSVEKKSGVDHVLTSKKKPVEWSGTIEPGDATPDVCGGNPCDSFPLQIDLPHNVWDHKPGAVQVAVRWDNLFDSLSLHVYQGDTLVASAEGEVSQGEIVMIPLAANGSYTVYVSWNPISEDEVVPYDLLAEVEYDLDLTPSRDLLPDLVMRSSPIVTFATPSFPIFGWPEPEPGDTCFPIETFEDGAHTCLRFDQVLANRGEGKLELKLAIPNDPDNPANNALQEISRTDGTTFDRVAGTWEFHPSHDHYHYQQFAQARLWNADEHGKRVGSAPVRTGQKVSFCIIDVIIDAWGEKGDIPRSYRVPRCLEPTEFDEAFSYIVSGITRGWADTYNWFLPDQYIEVSGLPDGHYIIESIADPENGILELDETNNCFGNHIFMKNVDLPSRSVDLLGDAKKCQ
jgi:hypothetical protein